MGLTLSLRCVMMPTVCSRLDRREVLFGSLDNLAERVRLLKGCLPTGTPGTQDVRLPDVPTPWPRSTLVQRKREAS